MSLAYGQQQQSQAAQQPPPNSQQHRAMPPNRAGPATGPPPPSSAHIQKILDENSSLIQTIQEYQHAGKGHECMNFHQNLHRNLVYLAQLAGLFTFVLLREKIESLTELSYGRKLNLCFVFVRYH